MIAGVGQTDPPFYAIFIKLQIYSAFFANKAPPRQSAAGL